MDRLNFYKFRIELESGHHDRVSGQSGAKIQLAPPVASLVWPHNYLSIVLLQLTIITMKKSNKRTGILRIPLIFDKLLKAQLKKPRTKKKVASKRLNLQKIIHHMILIVRSFYVSWLLLHRLMASITKKKNKFKVKSEEKRKSESEDERKGRHRIPPSILGVDVGAKLEEASSDVDPTMK